MEATEGQQEVSSSGSSIVFNHIAGVTYRSGVISVIFAEIKPW